MNYRQTQILAQKTLAASGTEVIDLDVQDPISAILFEYRNTRGGITDIEHLMACLSKVELVDGADVLFSLSGKQMQALDYYDAGLSSYTFNTWGIGIQELAGFTYHFGRKLWDPRLALDTKRFRNPQLKITHNRALKDASSSAHEIKIIGYVFDEKMPAPEGFLMSKEIKAFTSGAADSFEYTDLPLDHPIRKLLIYAYDDAYSPHQVVKEIRLSENNDRKVPVDEGLSTIMKAVNSMYPRWCETLYGPLTAVVSDRYVTPGFDAVVSGGAEGVAGYVGVEAGALHSPIGMYGNGNLTYRCQVSGFQPHSVVPVDFGDQQDPADWYDVTKLGNLKARTKAGTAGTAGAVALFAQQFRRY
jgi:hypothetical protein